MVHKVRVKGQPSPHNQERLEWEQTQNRRNPYPSLFPSPRPTQRLNPSPPLRHRPDRRCPLELRLLKFVKGTETQESRQLIECGS
jgi:hypothetical protein